MTGLDPRRKEAVRLAAEIVEQMGNAEDTNKRSYKIDGWKPMTGPERTDAIVRIAEVLIGPSPEESACQGPVARPADPPPPAPFPGRPPGSPA